MDTFTNNKTRYVLSMSEIEARARVNREKLDNINKLTQHTINTGYTRSPLPRNLVFYKRESLLSSLMMRIRVFLEGYNTEASESMVSNADTENI